MYNVTASLEGYEPATVTVTVPADGSGVQHAFRLAPLGGAAAALGGGAASGWGLPRRFGTFGGLSADATVRPPALGCCGVPKEKRTLVNTCPGCSALLCRCHTNWVAAAGGAASISAVPGHDNTGMLGLRTLALNPDLT